MNMTVGSRVPRRGNAVSRWVGRWALRLVRWRHSGALPDEPKFVLIGAPHTSNFDGVIAILSLIAIGVDARIMIKKSVFRGPLGWLLTWSGAVPVDRAKPQGAIEQTIEALDERQQMVLLLAPEGTRHSAPEWKRGFHYIAAGAKVPIVAAACNYRTRMITFGPPLVPSSDYPSDLAGILDFVNAHGYPRHPKRLSRPLRARSVSAPTLSPP